MMMVREQHAQDLQLEKKWKLKAGEIKIKQRVPNGQFALIPSPEFQVTQHKDGGHPRLMRALQGTTRQNSMPPL